MFPGNFQRRAHAHGNFFDDIERGLRLWPDDNRDTALDDAGLFRRHGGERVAEIFGVIERHRRYHADQRALDHIGCIEPAAEADFEQQKVGGTDEKTATGRRRW